MSQSRLTAVTLTLVIIGVVLLASGEVRDSGDNYVCSSTTYAPTDDDCSQTSPVTIIGGVVAGVGLLLALAGFVIKRPGEDERPPPPGWWQASDGNWYPPEARP